MKFSAKMYAGLVPTDWGTEQLVVISYTADHCEQKTKEWLDTSMRILAVAQRLARETDAPMPAGYECLSHNTYRIVEVQIQEKKARAEK